MQMRKKLSIFKHFAKSKKLFFWQYLSISVWFLLKFQKSIKLKPPNTHAPDQDVCRMKVTSSSFLNRILKARIHIGNSLSWEDLLDTTCPIVEIYWKQFRAWRAKHISGISGVTWEKFSSFSPDILLQFPPPPSPSPSLPSPHPPPSPFPLLHSPPFSDYLQTNIHAWVQYFYDFCEVYCTRFWFVLLTECLWKEMSSLDVFFNNTTFMF
jgi:hypothetical protein